jgi:hypothetical protein
MIDISTRAEMALRMPMRIWGSWLGGSLPQYETILPFVSLMRPYPPAGHGSVTTVNLASRETSGLFVS